MSIKRILQVTDALSHLLEKEHALLTERKLKEAQLLFKEKEQLSQLYQLEIARFQALEEKPSPESCELLAQKTEQLKEAMKENYKMISLAAQASESILSCIVDKFSEKDNKPLERYTAFAAVKRTGGPYNTPPLTLNERV